MLVTDVGERVDRRRRQSSISNRRACAGDAWSISPFPSASVLTPPWPQIYSTDPDRRHSLEKALAEYRLLLETYPSLGYDCQGLGCRNVPTSSSMHWQSRCHRRLSGRTPAVLGVSWRTAGIGAFRPLVQSRAAGRTSPLTGHPSGSIHRLGLGESPRTIEEFGSRAKEPHRVVPALHDRQAIGNSAVAAAELDGD